MMGSASVELDPLRAFPAARGLPSGFEDALAEARRGRLGLEQARVLLRGAGRSDRAARLFEAAAQVRDENLGRGIELTAHVHMVTPCELWTACRYCSLSSTIPSIRGQRTEMTGRRLAASVRYAVVRGVRSILLVGGTSPEGADDLVRAAVRTARSVTDAELAIDVGPSIAADTVDWLKAQNVPTVYCSIETIDRTAFRTAKPADSLRDRLAFSAMLQRHGMRLGNVVMNGLGRTEDLLRSILYLRRYPSLTHLYISTFRPVRGTPWAHRRPGSLRTSLGALAIARLALPKVNLGLAEVEVEDPGSVARLGSQLQAGGGNSLAGILIYRNRTVDNLDRIRAEARAMGFAA